MNCINGSSPQTCELIAPVLPFYRLEEKGTVQSDSESRSVVSDCLDYTVHGIRCVGVLKWMAGPFPRGSPDLDRAQVSHIVGGFFTSWATKGVFL